MKTELTDDHKRLIEMRWYRTISDIVDYRKKEEYGYYNNQPSQFSWEVENNADSRMVAAGLLKSCDFSLSLLNDYRYNFCEKEEEILDALSDKLDYYYRKAKSSNQDDSQFFIGWKLGYIHTEWSLSLTFDILKRSNIVVELDKVKYMIDRLEEKGFTVTPGNRIYV